MTDMIVIRRRNLRWESEGGKNENGMMKKNRRESGMTKTNGLAGTREDDGDEWQEKGGMTE